MYKEKAKPNGEVPENIKYPPVDSINSRAKFFNEKVNREQSNNVDSATAKCPECMGHMIRDGCGMMCLWCGYSEGCSQ